ncbi:unnamed protein product [Parajaminaea phylloscopi]
MRVCIVGAGFSGIAAAKILKEFGHEITVFETCPDVGGVWSSQRRYPGLGTQNVASTYHFSDMPMPKHYPEWPSAEQVQAYLEAYVAKHTLRDVIHCSTEVKSIERPVDSDRGWTVRVQAVPTAKSAPVASAAADSSVQVHRFDHVVVANGVFSQGAVPNIDQTPGFAAAGGQLIHTSDYTKLPETPENKHVVVVGYGRSACDIASHVAEIAHSTTLVARRLTWKLPRHLGHALNYKFMFLTRLGESLFEYIRPGFFERFMYSRIGTPIRKALFQSVGWVVSRQLLLDEVKAVPSGPFSDIATSRIALSTEGMYKKLREGKRLFLKRDMQIDQLYADAATNLPMARLSNGEEIRADVVLCGTGFHQKCPFLPRDIVDKLTDERGNWVGLYRLVLPIGVPDLTFNGYNSSLFCPTSSEMAALWIAGYLRDQQGEKRKSYGQGGDEQALLPLPSEEEQRKESARFFAWLDERSKGRHAHGTNIVPFSLHQVDDLLGDLGVSLSKADLLLQWLLPMSPTAYGTCIEQVKRKAGMA